jgi:hypothetical protein
MSWRPVRVFGVVAVVGVALQSTSAAHDAQPFQRHGITFEYPPSWVVTTRPLSNGVNPAYRFTVSTVPVRRTGSDLGPCLPGIAQQVPPSGALAYLREALGPDRTRSLPRMSPRPESFSLPTSADRSLCGFGRGGSWTPFKDSGRAFYLGTYVGPRASPSTRRALERVLDGMRIARR